MIFTFHFELDPDIPESLTYETDYETTFLQVLKGILEQLQNRYSLKQIAVVTPSGQPLSYDEVQLPLEEFIEQFGTELGITKRELVDGPNLERFFRSRRRRNTEF